MTTHSFKKPIIALVLAGIGIGALLLAADYFQRRKAFAERTACMGNLVRLKLAKELFAEDHGLTNGAVVPDAAIWRQLESTQHCWSGGRYSINPVGEWPTCSYTGAVNWAGRQWRHETQ